ncbi:MAG: flavodoxin family protein [Eubacteriaceae bacterium]
MKIQTVYFSLDGNTKLVAEAIGKALECQIISLETIKEFKGNGIGKYFSGGKSVFFKETPPLKPYENKLDGDLIILGFPIWASSIASPMRSFLKENNLSGKKVAIFICNKGGGPGKAFNEFEKLQPNAVLVKTLALVEPKEKETEDQIQRAIDWAKFLKMA